MCNYSGSHFGAPYPDACCIDGYLWDEDSCDEPGGPLYNGGDIPCPACNLDEFVEYHADDTWTSGNARQRRKNRRTYLRDLRARIVRKLGLNGANHAE
ncbi:hypothetical protein KDX27_30200 [Burkholderia cenocepacia]|uniref:hypothetical protein n=3 Tax=Burkholderia cenocepacia TaxID=95486 RepID=UPI001B9F7D29|nr:hypothetical protein [Burkholderia cenocepacia]MBR8028879.1 hypothetical protein [Burkholderia cenocepacia]MBR8172007.1 hypothetical protein [Burkholderia cenocepacia]